MSQDVVDAHIHLFRRGSLPKRWFAVGAERWAASKWPPLSPDAIDIEGGLIDDGAELVIPNMEAAGVQTSICLTLDWGVNLGEMPIPLRDTHSWYGELQKRFEGRFFAAAGCDPRRPDAVEIVDAALREHNLRGLKLYPPTGFTVDDERCAPLLGKCIDFNVPVIIHTAFVGYPHVARHADPKFVNDIQVRYPDLKVVLAHSGYPIWLEDAIEVASHHPDTYLEISNWNLLIRSEPERVKRSLTEMIKRVGAHRIIFASDNLGGRRFSGQRSSLPSWVEFVRALPSWSAANGVDISQEELDLIMGGNARRVFRLEN